MLNLSPTKTGVRFEWSDADSETVVTLDKSEDTETIVRKLQKVLELAKPTPPAPAAMRRLEERGQAMQTTTVGQPATAGGWHKAPEVPERLQGEVELIGEGEQ